MGHHGDAIAIAQIDDSDRQGRRVLSRATG